jgi:hypothetical protein
MGSKGSFPTNILLLPMGSNLMDHLAFTGHNNEDYNTEVDLAKAMCKQKCDTARPVIHKTEGNSNM